VKDAITRITRETPTKRVGLVTFGSLVTVIGDGTQAPKKIIGATLNNNEDLLTTNVEAGTYLSKPVAERGEKLVKRTNTLFGFGDTALGPGVVVSILLAASRGPGSRVILCTDGLANVGVGAVKGSDVAAADRWYRETGAFAASKGVTISVLGLRGCDCRMEYLGTLAELTGGQVDIVNPNAAAKEFDMIVSKSVIATNTSVTLRLHTGLKIIEEETGHDGNLVRKDIGNVTTGTELTFEYSIVDWKRLCELGIASLPFQVQIRFTRLDGAKIIRVITQRQQVTTERAKAEAEVKVDIMATYIAQQAAKLAHVTFLLFFSSLLSLLHFSLSFTSPFLFFSSLLFSSALLHSLRLTSFLSGGRILQSESSQLGQREDV
jgi:hypothetical protein